jgi:methoxymalonate biosynthesis acyl carrier protein
MEYKQKIRDFVENNFIMDDSHAELSDDDNFFALGFVSSLFSMKLVTFIESEFNIEILNQDLDINNFSSINRIVDFILRKNK